MFRDVYFLKCCPLFLGSIHHKGIIREKAHFGKESTEPLKHSFTPSLTHRLNNEYVEESRIYLYGSSPILRNLNASSPKFEHDKKNLRRSSSLLTPRDESFGYPFNSFRKINSLMNFGPKEMLFPHKWPRMVKENGDNYNADKTQQLSFVNTDAWNNDAEGTLISERTSIAAYDSSANLHESAFNRSILSCESSPTKSFSNFLDHGLPYKSQASKNSEIRLLAEERLIEASKFKNVDNSNFVLNLHLKHNNKKTEEDKCFDVISDPTNLRIAKRSNSISSPPLKSSSLNREYLSDRNRRTSFAGSQNTLSVIIPTSGQPNLSKFRRFGCYQEHLKNELKEEKKQRRISRFLRPDFFDTPREESQYFKEKEVKKTLENERRKARFIKKREHKAFGESENIPSLENELNSIMKEEWGSLSGNKASHFESEMQNGMLCGTSDHQIKQIARSSGDNLALPRTYIPKNPNVIVKTFSVKRVPNKETFVTSSLSKNPYELKTVTKNEIRTEDEVDPRLRSKIPMKFKKCESNNAKLISGSKKSSHKNVDDLGESSLQKLKKENQSNLLQRSRIEVTKSLENCSKFVKKYSLEKTKKIKTEKTDEIIKSNQAESLTEKKKFTEKIITKNIDLLEKTAPKASPEKKPLLRISEKVCDATKDMSVDNAFKASSKKYAKMVCVLPSLSKTNLATHKCNNERGEKLPKRKKMYEAKEKENDKSTIKKTIACGVKKAEYISINKFIQLSEKAKKCLETVSKDVNDILVETSAVTFKKIECNNIEEKSTQSSPTLRKLEEKFNNTTLAKNISSYLKSKNLKESSTSNFENAELISTRDDSQLVVKSNIKQSLETSKESEEYEICDNLVTNDLKNFCEINSEERIYSLINVLDASSNQTLFLAENTEQSFSSLPASSSILRDQPKQESITDRIKRKSFYSRFNDRKRKTLRTTLSSRTAYLSSMTLPRNFSFTNFKNKDIIKKDNYVENNMLPLEKRYSLHNNILSSTNSSAGRNRNFTYSVDTISSSDSIHNHVRCTSIDTSNVQKKHPSTNFGLNKEVSVDGGDIMTPRKERSTELNMIKHNAEILTSNSFEYGTSPSISNKNFGRRCYSCHLKMERSVDLIQAYTEDQQILPCLDDSTSYSNGNSEK